MLRKLRIMISLLFNKFDPKILLITIISKAGRYLLKDVLDPVFQRKAKEFVIELNDDNSLTGIQKMNKFNIKFLEWLAKEGLRMTTSQLNFLREWAVVAVKVESRASEYSLSSSEI